jgi:hypothetical protein
MLSYILFFCIAGIILLGLLSLTIVGQALTPTTYFTQTDRDRVRQIFLAASGDDLESLYYSVIGFNLIDTGVADAAVSLYSLYYCSSWR